ncbi:hypothetical protein JW949_04115 [Candidatus Woesearchaeota archaeon]|nr:hypothetical protein [Candidatus Woesearchaeota archaeon]
MPIEKINGKYINDFNNRKIPVSELEESLNNIIWKRQLWARHNIMFGNRDKGTECLLFIDMINKEFGTNYEDMPDEIIEHQTEAEVGLYGNKTGKYWPKEGDKIMPLLKQD